MKEGPPFLEVWGDTPPDLDHLAGEIKVDDTPNPSRLKERALAYLRDNPDLLRQARVKGQDLIAVVSPHGKQILVGVGIATALATTTIGGILLYKHARQDRSAEDQE